MAKVKCPECGKEFSEAGIGTHYFRAHTKKGRAFKPNRKKRTKKKGENQSNVTYSADSIAYCPACQRCHQGKDIYPKNNIPSIGKEKRLCRECDEN